MKRAAEILLISDEMQWKTQAPPANETMDGAQTLLVSR